MTDLAPRHNWQWDQRHRRTVCKFCGVLLLPRTREVECKDPRALQAQQETSEDE